MKISLKARATPEVLVWARDSAGFSQEEIADKLRQKSATLEAIEAWEDGREQPTYAQLEKLANIYKRPIAVFFFPSPPEEPSLNEKFRSLPKIFTQSFPPKIRYLVREALVKQMDLYDLHGEGNPADIEIFKSKTKDVPQNNVKTLAARVREILDVPLNEQFKWKTEDEALKQWRNKLENVGIWIFKDAFQSEDYYGFCLYDEHFPLIYLNNSIPKQRQIFTLFHEVGHLLIAKGGVDFRHDADDEFQGIYRKDETFCNAFAGELLVPDDSFPISNVPSDDQIFGFAKKYNVSREVILRKCLNRNLVTQEVYNNKVMEWRKNWEKSGTQNKKGEVKGNYYATQKVYLGEYLSLLFRQYYQQRIDEYKHYLGVKVRSVPIS